MTKKDSICSVAEQAFWLVLEEITTQPVSFCPKVRLADLITFDPQLLRSPFFSQTAQKHVDFVMLGRGRGDIRLVIELDDNTHLTARAKRRDQFVDEVLGEAGIPLLRIRAAARYDTAEVKNRIQDAIRQHRKKSAVAA